MFSNLIALICSYIYNPRSVNYEKLYAVATFLDPLQSNLLSEPEKKIAQEYFKTEVTKLEENYVAARENNNTRVTRVERIKRTQIRRMLKHTSLVLVCSPSSDVVALLFRSSCMPT